MTTRSTDFGKILCAWDDCGRVGHLEHGFQWPEDRHERGPIYLFCTERHKALYVNSPRAKNYLPVGSKGLAAPR